MTTELIANEPSGLRGWLAVMGIGITVAPIRALVGWAEIAADPVMAEGLKSAVPLARNIAMATHGLSALGVAGSLWLAFLFFGKDRRFPSHYMALQLGSLAVVAAFGAWITNVTGTNVLPEMTREIAVDAIAALLWIAYLHNSKRVANTFVK